MYIAVKQKKILLLNSSVIVTLWAKQAAFNVEFNKSLLCFAAIFFQGPTAPRRPGPP
jgi:hypothetical protein